MTSHTSSRSIYRRVQTPPKASDPSIPWEKIAPKSSPPRKVSWRAPETMLFALLIGLGLALAHHFMGLSLNRKPMIQVGLSQGWVFRFGTALAFLVKLALATAVGAAYTQHQWLRFRKKSFRTSDIDALISVLANAFSFLSSTVWAKHPVLALMALISWGIPLAAIVAPGSLTVSPQTTDETLQLRVRQPDFNFTNFGSFTGGGGQILLGNAKIYSLAYRTASTGLPISMNSPENYQNASYRLDFHGPAIKCGPANETFIHNLTHDYGLEKYQRDMTLFLSWVGPSIPSADYEPSGAALDTISTDGARIYILNNQGTWNVTRTYDSHIASDGSQQTKTHRQVNVTECVLFNATYGVDYQFTYPDQTRQASVSSWNNPTALQSSYIQTKGYVQSTGEYGDSTVADHTFSYGSVMDAFGQMLVGEVTRDRYSTQRVTSTIWKLVPIDWKDSRAVILGLESLFQNITLSLLSDDALIKNGTSAELVPVTVNTWPTTYVYTASELLLAYGVAFLCALSCSVVGLYAFYVNDASYQNLFSTYIRATNDLDIRSQTELGDDGADPLPRAFAKSHVALGGRQEPSDADAEPGETEDVELQRLSLEETGPSLESEWASLGHVYCRKSLQDGRAGSIVSEEYDPSGDAASSTITDHDQTSQDDPHTQQPQTDDNLRRSSQRDTSATD